jgi:hypothetical protein
MPKVARAGSKSCKVSSVLRMRSQLMRWLLGGEGIILRLDAEEEGRDSPLLHAEDRSVSTKRFVKL